MATLGAKAAFVVAGLPSMWIWGDEMLYYATSYDLLHLGQAGVPHPAFLNYPPLTSVLVFPVHLLGLSGAAAYQASLVILSLVQAAGAVGGYLLAWEVFGLRSRALLALLLLGPPAWASFSLMSEAPFIALYLWLLLFTARLLETGRARHAVAIGLLAGAMILTRKNGIGVLASVALMPFLELILDRPRFRRALALAALSLGVALAVSLAWKLTLTHGLDARHGYYGAAGYLEKGFLPALESPRAFLAFLRRVLANYGYVSLATFGVAIPLVAAFCLDRSATVESVAAARRRVIRLACHVAVFFLFSGFAAGLQMFIQRAHPNTRYLMYGRYMDYFPAPLVVLAFGIVVCHRWGPGMRRALIAGTGVLGLLISVAVPLRFFASESGAPSNMGIGWLFALAAGSGPAAAAIAPALALAAIAVLTRAGWIEPAGRAGAVFAFVMALCLFNLAVVGGWAASRSQAFQAEYGRFSDFVSRHPEHFRDGLYVDAYSYAEKRLRRDRLATHKLLADQLHRVTVGREAEARLGRVPVMTMVRHDGVPVLFEAEGFSNRIYGLRP